MNIVHVFERLKLCRFYLSHISTLYMVIHDNLYNGVTLISEKQKPIKTMECYEQ